MACRRAPDHVQAERRALLQDIWHKRLAAAQREPDTWQRLLAVRSLLVRSFSFLSLLSP